MLEVTDISESTEQPSEQNWQFIMSRDTLSVLSATHSIQR